MESRIWLRIGLLIMRRIVHYSVRSVILERRAVALSMDAMTMEREVLSMSR